MQSQWCTGSSYIPLKQLQCLGTSGVWL